MNAGEILIIGGNGFIGSALCRRLAGRGEIVHLLSRGLPEGPLPAGVRCYQAGLDNRARIAPLLAQCSMVFYLASDTTPGQSAHAPAAEMNANLIPFAGFLELMQEHSATPLIYFSSGGTVYGNPAGCPVIETQPTAPLSYHGAGKVAMEAFLHAFSHQTKTPVVVLRPSNVYGPGQRPRQGFGLISTLLYKVRRGEVLEIWGDGENIRDYLYIDDCIDACECLLEQRERIAGFGLYNLGSGQGHSTNQVCDRVEGVTGLPVARRYSESRSIDVRTVVLDCGRFQKDFGWSPRVSLPEGIGRTWSGLVDDSTLKPQA